jgi:formyltetrahydrofolate deformylase
MHRDRFYTLTASCPDQVGIIARVSGFIAEHRGWILESSFHADAVDGRYFMRIEIKADSLPIRWPSCASASRRWRPSSQMDWRSATRR